MSAVLVRMPAVAPAYARTRIGIVLAAFLAPFSATHLIGSLTVGRVAALAFAALLAVDLLRQRPLRFRPDLPTLMLVAGYLGLCGWAFLSAKTVGCNCEGKAGGLFELTVIGLLAIVAIGFEPRLRDSALLAALAGATLAAALALAGVGAINSGTVDLTDTGGRLSGSYGNANELGLATALGLPVALAYLLAAGRAARWILLGAIAILLLALALTYSRGGIIAAGAGVFALALWEGRRSRRRLALTAAAALLALLVAGALYSIFEDRREEASFAPPPAALRPLDQRDVSGWDSRALGPIPHGPSRLRNGRGGIVVRGRRGEGASFRWGEALPGHTYVLRTSVAAAGAPPGSRLLYSLSDRVAGGGVAASARLGRQRRTLTLTLTWRPRIRAPHAALFLWQTGARTGFAITGAQVTDRGGSTIFAPSQLRGSVYAHLASDASAQEERYVESRLDAARLAWRAFRSAPLEGIGWSTFPSYSAKRADYGRLAAHDQYLLIAAELGLIGLFFLALLIAAPVLGARRSPPDRATAAAIGTLAAAAAGMVFVETLASPHLAIPIAVAASTLTARMRPTG